MGCRLWGLTESDMTEASKQQGYIKELFLEALKMSFYSIKGLIIFPYINSRQRTLHASVTSDLTIFVRIGVYSVIHASCLTFEHERIWFR